MKKRIFYIMCLLLPLLTRAQWRDEPITNLEHMDERKFQWGYYLGLNRMDYHFDLKEINYDDKLLKEIQIRKTTGFNLGITFNIRLIDYLDLRVEPGLFHNQRSLVFPGIENEKNSQRTVTSTYMYFPVLLKFSAMRWYNFKPYITAGGSVVYNLSSVQDFDIDTYEYKIFPLKNWVFHYEIGLGIDLYTPYFRFSPSIRGLFGINNEMGLHQGKLTKNLNGLYTRGIMLCLTFE